MTDWAAGACGGAVVVSGDNASWATWADDSATIVVPSKAEAGSTTITFTYSESTTANAASGTSASTASGSVDIVITVAKSSKSDSKSPASPAGMAASASLVVAGVLGGSLFASLFMPTPVDVSAAI